MGKNTGANSMLSKVQCHTKRQTCIPSLSPSFAGKASKMVHDYVVLPITKQQAQL